MMLNRKFNCKKLLLANRSIKSTTNKELVDLLKDKTAHELTHGLLVEEFNSRLIKPRPQPEPEQVVEDAGAVGKNLKKVCDYIDQHDVRR